MTAFFIQFLVAWVLLMFLHVSALALAGKAFGIQLLELSFGSGPLVFRRGLMKIRAIPYGGYAKFSDTRETPDADHATAFNYKPFYVRALVPLLGPLALIVLAVLILGSAGMSETLEGFRQLVVGAFGPTSTAQGYIRAFHELSVSHGFVAVLAVLATKVAAFNLLPMPLLNGGQALMALIPGDREAEPPWQNGVLNVSFFALLALLLSWAYAIVLFAIEKS